MKQRWFELTWPQRVMILLQAFLILLFLILYCITGRQQVMEYRGEYLRCRTDGEVTTYSGKVDGQKAVFTVTAGHTVEFRLGDTAYGPYTIAFDSASEAGTAAFAPVGVEVWEGETRLFHGSYTKSSSSFYLSDEDDPLILSDKKVLTTVEGSYGSVMTYVYPDEPGPYSILKAATGSGVAQRGSFGMYFLGVALCLVCALMILYADKLFRWNLKFVIADPQRAEPSDWELFSRWISWIMFTILALVYFCMSLNAH